MTLRPVALVARSPLAGMASAAIDAGVNLERRALDLVLDSDELPRIISTTLDSPRVAAAFDRALASDGAERLIAGLLASNAFDELVDGLLASDALWRLIDTVLDRLPAGDALWRMVDDVAGSPAVTAAITQQGVGFVGEVRDGVRAHSRRADDWLARAARRRAAAQEARPAASAPGAPGAPGAAGEGDPPAIGSAEPRSPTGDQPSPGCP
ncbi:MAG: hypothetical protein ACLP22_20335 [Solirubrobacteraceae bacterium]